jgi:hypothetical protein
MNTSINSLGLLSDHMGLAARLEASTERFHSVREMFSSDELLSNDKLSIFCAGSLGRGECSAFSDLDVFAITTDEDASRLFEVKVLSKLIELNDKLGFPAFSQAMRYLRLYKYKDLVDHTGKPIDDSENSFTTRMLLILESKALSNNEKYENVMSGVVTNYFRDNLGKSDFRPLFLINDLLRYWRTLCLNYEECRGDHSKPWRKKNINLKFSRMTTVFSTVCLLMVERPREAEEFLSMAKLTPLERLARAVHGLDDPELLCRFEIFLDGYEDFLKLKDHPNPESLAADPGRKEDLRKAAAESSAFLYDCLMHKKNSDLRHYLVL